MNKMMIKMLAERFIRLGGMHAELLGDDNSPVSIAYNKLVEVVEYSADHEAACDFAGSIVDSFNY